MSGRILAGIPVSGTRGAVAQIDAGSIWQTQAETSEGLELSRVRWLTSAPGLLLLNLRVDLFSIEFGVSAGIALELGGLWRFPAVYAPAGARLTASFRNYSAARVALIEFVWWGI